MSTLGGVEKLRNGEMEKYYDPEFVEGNLDALSQSVNAISFQFVLQSLQSLSYKGRVFLR